MLGMYYYNLQDINRLRRTYIFAIKDGTNRFSLKKKKERKKEWN